jgi:hypothetical protein
VALREAIQALIACLEQLEHDDLGHLHWAVTQGRPKRRPRLHKDKSQRPSNKGPSYLPRRYAELSLELVHRSREALQSAKRLLGEVTNAKANLQLTATFNECHQHVELIAKSMLDDFESERMAELEQFAQEKRKGWPAWASGVSQAVPPCRRRLHETQRTMIELLRELAERGNASAVVVHNQCSGPTVNVGQRGVGEVVAGT